MATPIRISSAPGLTPPPFPSPLAHRGDDTLLSATPRTHKGEAMRTDTELPYTAGPLAVGYYRPTEAFKAIPEYVAVMRGDQSLVAVCGPVGDPASEADARLYAAAPELLAALMDLAKRCDSADGVMSDGSNICTRWASAVIAKATPEIESTH